jgi:Family of unknown function (DUF5677)
MTISPEEAIERQLNACTETGSYLPGRDLMMDTYMEQIVAGTAARAQETFYAICQLARDRQTVQAAMLCRSLFEDMIVAHWLVLHEDDPEFLVERYLGHLDAMRWNEAVTAGRHGVEPPDVSELAGREDELRREFGDYAQRDWWGVRRNGSRITMPEVVTVLEEAERFHPRMRGEKPILREMYEKAQKWNTQLLHHTASGMPLALNRDDQLKPRTIQAPVEITVLAQAYWVHAQLVLLVLDIAPNQDWREFEAIFLRGLLDGFGFAVSTPEFEKFQDRLDGRG